MVHWFIEFSNCWFIDSYIPWFSDSLPHWFTASLICWLIDSLDRSQSLIHLFTDSLLHWLIESLNHGFIDSLICCSLHRFIDSLNSSTNSLIHCFIERFVASFSCAMIPSCYVIGISTTICSFVDAPHDFKISLLLHHKGFPLDIWCPIVTSYPRKFRPSACRALPRRSTDLEPSTGQSVN